MQIWKPPLFLFHLLLSIVGAWELTTSSFRSPHTHGVARTSARALGVQPVLCKVVYSLPMTHPQQPSAGSVQAGPRHGGERKTMVLKAHWDPEMRQGLVESLPKQPWTRGEGTGICGAKWARPGQVEKICSGSSPLILSLPTLHQGLTLGAGASAGLGLQELAG